MYTVQFTKSFWRFVNSFILPYSKTCVSLQYCMSYLGHFRNEDHHGVRLADNLHGGKNTGEATISRRDLITCICLNLISALFPLCWQSVQKCLNRLRHVPQSRYLCSILLSVSTASHHFPLCSKQALHKTIYNHPSSDLGESLYNNRLCCSLLS